MRDILDTIDEAVGCQQCGSPLGSSPSDDFCNDWCQQQWHAAHTQPLVGYQEPWHRPWDFPGVGTEAAVSGPERVHLRPDVGDESYFFRSPSRVLISEDGENWREIGTVPAGGASVRWTLASPVRPAAGPLAGISVSWNPHSAGPDLRRIQSWLADPSGIQTPWALDAQRLNDEEDAQEDVRERALQARRNRNTGPARNPHRRPPRNLDARR